MPHNALRAPAAALVALRACGLYKSPRLLTRAFMGASAGFDGSDHRHHLGALATWVLALLIALMVYLALATPPALGVTAARDKGGRVTVTWVTPDGPADSAGVRPGDTILRWTPAALVVQDRARPISVGVRAAGPTVCDLLDAALGLGLVLVGGRLLGGSPDRTAGRAFWRMGATSGLALGAVAAAIHGLPWAIMLQAMAERLAGPAFLEALLAVPATASRSRWLTGRRRLLLWTPAVALILLYLLRWLRLLPSAGLAGLFLVVLAGYSAPPASTSWSC